MLKMPTHPLFKQLARLSFGAVGEAVINVTRHGFEDSHHLRVEMAAGVFVQNRHGRVKPHGFLVGPFGAQRVKHIGYGKDAR